MLTLGNRSISIMVLYCICLHLWWAVMITMDGSALMTTSVDALHRIVNDRAILVMLLVAASCASILGMIIDRAWAATLLLPQQIMLMLSATGAIGAIWLSQFADGVVRPREFIAADQFHIFFAAIGHTIAIIMHVKQRGWDA